MNKLIAVVVDDEEDSRQTLCNFLTRYCPEIHIGGQADSVSTAVKVIDKVKPSLVFLDINMPHENGFGLFTRFNVPDFHTIFVTAYNEFALQAIKHHALDYILKPVNIDELIAAVSRARSIGNNYSLNEKIQTMLQTFQKTQAPEKIALPVLDGFIYIPVNEIIRCEAEGNYTCFHFTSRTKMLVSRTVGSFESQLKNYGFIRVHHHHLINPNHIEKYQRGRGGIVFMSDKKEVIVSQRKRVEFLKLIGLNSFESPESLNLADGD